MSRFGPSIVAALLVAILVGGFGSALTAGAQTMPMSMPSPTASVAPMPRLTLSRELLAGLPRTTVTAADETGESATYSGVDLGTLLAKNGAPHGESIRGRAAADYVVARASDGYRAVFALIELDPRFTNKVVLVADRRDGAPLGADGPFRVVVPDEEQHARWVRNLTELELFTAQ